jgi:hypothetical protein
MLLPSTATLWMLRTLCAALMATLLAACGGGGGGGAVATGPGASSPITLSGIAATGAAIPSGTISTRCVSGTPAVATTSASGAFSIDITSATLPCMLELQYTDAASATQYLHSYATSAGVVNITPLTELIVAAALRGVPQTSFTAATLDWSAISANIVTGIATVRARLASLGVAVANFPTNPIIEAFVAAYAAITGDSVDALLDDLRAKIASTSTPLSTLVTQVAAGQTTNSPSSGGGTPTVGLLGTLDWAKPACTGASCPTLSLFAGNTGGTGNVDGLGNAARLSLPGPMVMNADGSFFLTDGQRIRRVSAGYDTSTVWQKYSFLPNRYPADEVGGYGLAKDSLGNLYSSYRNSIIKISPDNTRTVWISTPDSTAAATNGTGSGANFTRAGAIVVDSHDNVFVEDCNSIRKITPAGVVTTFAGALGSNSTTSGIVDDPVGTNARFTSCGFVLPAQNLVIDAADNLFMMDSGTIRKITPAGAVTTHFDSTKTGGGGNTLARNSAGTFYFFRLGVLRSVAADGTTATVAGSSGSGANDGLLGVATFFNANSLAIDPQGDILVSDGTYFGGYMLVRKVNAVTGQVDTVVGSPQGANSSGANGLGAAARFGIGPGPLATDAAGNTYVYEYSSIRKIDSAGLVTTAASTPTGNLGALWASNYKKIADSFGNYYTVDTFNHVVIKTTSGGVTSTFAGQYGIVGNTDSTIGSSATFKTPSGLAIDAANNLYLISFSTLNSSRILRKISNTGEVSTVYTTDGNVSTYDGSPFLGAFLEVDSMGNVYSGGTVNPGGSITKITPAGVATTVIDYQYGGIRLGDRPSLDGVYGMALLDDHTLVIKSGAAVLKLALP